MDAIYHPDFRGQARPTTILTRQKGIPMHRQKGFTLIELMIVVAIIAILAAIALPSYTEYVVRGKITEATATLSDLRVKMEQYYMDNRRYSTTAGGGTCGLAGGNSPTVAQAKYFTYTCSSGGTTAAGDQTYTLTASGSTTQGMTGFRFTIDESNTKRTAAVGSGWTVPASNCWVQKKGGTC